MKKTAVKLILLILAVCLLSGCGMTGSTAPSQDELPDVLGVAATGKELKQRTAADSIFTLNYDPSAGINPIRADSAANMQFWSLMYDSVFTVDENFEYASEVVTEIKSDDYIWWVFNIDTTIPFTDGSTLSAKDIVYSIQRAQQSSYYRERLSIIYGISAMSDDCFAITTQYANCQFPALLTIPIIKKDSYFDEVPAGSGPYKLAETGDRLELFAKNRHASEMPLPTIYLSDFMDTSDKIRAFEDARLDLVTNDPTGMYNLGYGSSNETRYFDTSNMHFIGFNTESMFFLSAAARKAVGFVVDRNYVVNDLMGGCGIVSSLPVHPRSILYDSAYADSFIFDANSASLMFENAGVSDYDRDGDLEMLVTGIVVELKIDFIVNNDSTAKVLAARRITEELNAIGITTNLRELSWTDYMTALQAGNYDMYYGEIRLTPDWNLSGMFRPREGKKASEYTGINYGRFHDWTYCNLYETYLAAADFDVRYKAMQDICRYIGDTGAIVPVCFERREILTHRNVITGISATQYDIFYNFKDWTINLT